MNTLGYFKYQHFFSTVYHPLQLKMKKTSIFMQFMETKYNFLIVAMFPVRRF